MGMDDNMRMRDTVKNSDNSVKILLAPLKSGLVYRDTTSQLAFYINIQWAVLGPL